MFTFFCRVFCLISCTAFVYAGDLTQEPPAQTFLIPQTSSKDINHEDFYFKQLLTLALDKSKSDFSPYQLKEHPVWLTDSRLQATLAHGSIDIVWSATSVRAEQTLLPIKVPLLKDLDNYRVLLIRGHEQARFARVNTVEDLRKFTGGMSAQWPDAEIMLHNELPIVTATGYGKFFRMLAAGRFDYFSRGLYQAQTEVNFYPELNLEIEERILLHYPNPYYYFVNKNNALLAQRIEMGLDIAMKDGSFDSLFNSIPRYFWAQQQLQLEKRKIIDLSVPDTR